MNFNKFKTEIKLKQINYFLSGFKTPVLRKVISFYQLEDECMDLRKRQCLQKVIRQNLSKKEVWKAVIEIHH